jgi:predicted acyl esterase/enamine deaminase RidA (YjgF/YER057c/UK114 family)
MLSANVSVKHLNHRVRGHRPFLQSPEVAMRSFSYLALVWLVAASGQAVAQNDLDLGRITERHEMIPMRDGQRLSAYLYFPPGDGPWPVVFEQRYADLRGAGTRKAAARLAEAGYVVALVNFRGTHQSQGDWVGYRALGWGELKDGYDTCEWLAAQRWSTGGVGTFGSSQGGFAQNFLAVTEPPHLKCQYMVDTGLSLFQEGYRIGGVTRPNRFQAMEKICHNPADNARLLAEWFRHPDYDDYWRQEDCSLHFDQMNVPCFTIGSWFDFMNQGSIASFIGRQHHGGPNSRGKQQLVIGPWLHGRLNKTNRVGELVFPENAAFPEYEHMVRWFDHWLKGKDTGVLRDPAVRYYVMGAVGEKDAPGNLWRESADWPPPSDGRPLYLQPGGGLALDAPQSKEGATSYVSDPLDPVQIPGTAFPGARDARKFEEQAEVRTFTTKPLAEPVEWTGRVRAELYVSSTARDTDFLVRISDVYPDGRSILICDYPRRARYREGFDHQVLMQPGKVEKIAFDVGWISQIFNRGHRIRVTVSATGSPLYDPNPQTGGEQTIDFPANPVKAVNAIHHDRVHASRIIAPIAMQPVAVQPVAVQPVAAQVGRDSGPPSPLRHIESVAGAGSGGAVVVPDRPLLHTEQLLPVGADHQVTHAGDAAAQLDDCLRRLDAVLHDAGSGRDRVAKLNLYVAKESLASDIEKRVRAAAGLRPAPAISLVVTRLPLPAALVALDAIAVADKNEPVLSVTPFRGGSVMPAGSRIYVSGQAEKADTLREATRKTLDSLTATLQHSGRASGDFVQLKCFFQPMTSISEVRAAISDYFAPKAPPPVVYVEWKAAAPPIEIEAICWGGPANNDAKEPLEFLTPPGMTKSPVYSRVARLHRGGTIYIGDLFGPAGASAEEQLQASFGQLGKLLEQAGSDMQHLAKATYYVTDDEVSKAHNAIRQRYYDAGRPPAASKALVESTGRPGVRYVMDMIAVGSK